jgi:signal transduction histidine kinase
MNNKNSDLTRILISGEYIYSRLGSLFPDSVFLDLNFNIISACSHVQQELGFREDELAGKSIACIERRGLLVKKLRQRLENGYFSDLEVDLNRKSGDTVRYTISGFHLGLISDMGEIIVLKLSNHQEAGILNQQLQLAKTQLDNFIYRTAHDIRGPLATIQGLVNLLKLRTDNSEIDRFIEMIDVHSKQLDERLHQLVYLAQAEDEPIEATHLVNFSELETHIRKVIEQNAFLDFLELKFVPHTESVHGINEILLRKLLTNIILYILTLEKKTEGTKIIVECNCNTSQLSVTIRSEGFAVDSIAKLGINEGTASMYTDLLQHSKLTHIFAAQKIAAKLKATVNIDFSSSECQQITVHCPVNR